MAKKILVVDDEPIILKVVTFRLQKMGYDIVTAIDGLEAVEVTKKEKPDLIILDVVLPGMNGLEVCKTIKKDDKLKNTPIILLTASLENLEEKAKECNADDYSLKPFDPEVLMEKIKKFIG